MIQCNDAGGLTGDRIVTVFVRKVQFLEHGRLECKLKGCLVNLITGGSGSSWMFNQDTGVAGGHKEWLPMDQ